ncbi:GlsB/YeaQ/YmgE family stress response membrane protein [Nocardioides mangrovicus]|uniref:GlsB/YeaQ/YmgE family stress response membrane protein n=1 Tax=Nocardioides mangrovicus TaxID=2478913 RepID=A0A3L8NZV8_9ACTN|nr:GlsB/YeaQ/YmgE family stress response membrane protein [Nocardioides mangrovicus]RLV48311.1 GlsB/YeaQ/YmgE family stress response membrane protein [Nocardioides mangrovicus]
MLGLILTILIVGAIAEFIARLLVPGRQHMSVLATIALGVVGSLIGGFLGYVLFHKDAQDGLFQPSGIVGSIIGAVIALVIWQMTQRRHDARV